MPLLVSPIDGSPMKQINRYGIEIDMCPTTGGVWLDKGELEKLMSLVKDAVNDDDHDFREFKTAKAKRQLPPDYYEPVSHQPPPPPFGYKKYDDDDYEDYYKYKYKKKSKLKSILDIFD